MAAVEIVQLPLNLLDQRFVQDGTLAELARRGTEVHVRSVFLQGVLLTDGAKLPAHFAPVRGRIDRFQAECAAATVPRAAAALGFAAPGQRGDLKDRGAPRQGERWALRPPGSSVPTRGAPASRSP